MAKYCLSCSCGSYDFIYEDGVGFTCEDCGNVFAEDIAGYWLYDADEK